MVCSLVSITFIVLNLASNKTIYKTLEYWSRDMLNFGFLEKGLGIVSLLHFVYNFSRKLFLMLYSINWPNVIAWLPFLLEILGNMCIAIVCKPDCGVIDFKFSLIFLIKPFSYCPKRQDKNLNIVRTKRAFKVK